MTFGVYAMRDALVGFCAPTLDSTDQSAMRGFADALNRSDTLPCLHPVDFGLYRVGYFDSDSGSLTPCDPPVWLCDGAGLTSDRGDN